MPIDTEMIERLNASFDADYKHYLAHMWPRWANWQSDCCKTDPEYVEWLIEHEQDV